jgi:hypothetical protein
VARFVILFPPVPCAKLTPFQQVHAAQGGMDLNGLIHIYERSKPISVDSKVACRTRS